MAMRIRRELTLRVELFNFLIDQIKHLNYENSELKEVLKKEKADDCSDCDSELLDQNKRLSSQLTTLEHDNKQLLRAMDFREKNRGIVENLNYQGLVELERLQNEVKELKEKNKKLKNRHFYVSDEKFIICNELDCINRVTPNSICCREKCKR
jgi:hypothetical protein